MNNRTCRLALLLALLPLIRLDAADPVAFPKGDAAWKVDVMPKGSSDSSALRQITKAEVTQVSGTKRIVLTWSDGKVTEKWSLVGLNVIFEEDPRNGVVTPFQNSSLGTRNNNLTLTYDSFAFSWLSPAYLQEQTPVSYEGKQCFHYAADKKEAWIDSTTLLPVALDNGSSLSTYTFSPTPPTGPLVPPPGFQTAIRYYKVTMGYP